MILFHAGEVAGNKLGSDCYINIKHVVVSFIAFNEMRLCSRLGTKMELM